MKSNTVKGPEQYVQFAIICIKKKKKKNRRMSKRFYVHGIVLEGSFTKCFIFFKIPHNVNVLFIINEIFCHYKNNLLYYKYSN